MSVSPASPSVIASETNVIAVDACISTVGATISNSVSASMSSLPSEDELILRSASRNSTLLFVLEKKQPTSDLITLVNPQLLAGYSVFLTLKYIAFFRF